MVLQYPIACSLSSLRLVAWRLRGTCPTLPKRQVTCCLVKCDGACAELIWHIPSFECSRENSHLTPDPLDGAPDYTISIPTDQGSSLIKRNRLLVD